MTAPAIYRKTAVDSVQLAGWTPDTVQRALTALTALCAKAPADDDTQLAVELTHRLRCAALEDPRSLVEYLAERQPTGEDESPWEKLECLLAQDEPLETSLAHLHARYPDPVSVLCILLDEKVAPGEEWGDLERHYQRAVEILLALGTRESLRYLLAHMDLLCLDSSHSLESLLEPHQAMFTQLGLEAWPGLSWRDRDYLLEICTHCDIDAMPLLPLLVAVDCDAMNYKDLATYVDLLARFDDPRAARRLRQLMARALADLERKRSEQVRRFARKAGGLLVEELGRPINPKLRSRAAALGIRWPRNGPRPDRRVASIRP
jgi:hypothetical protein